MTVVNEAEDWLVTTSSMRSVYDWLGAMPQTTMLKWFWIQMDRIWGAISFNLGDAKSPLPSSFRCLQVVAQSIHACNMHVQKQS